MKPSRLGGDGNALWPEHPYARAIERRGRSLRERLQLQDLDPLDPRALIGTFDHMVVESVHAAVPHTHEGARLVEEAGNRWWAAAYREGDGPWLILYNPLQTTTRLHASLMEEVAHIVLEHKPCTISVDPILGVPRRTYRRSQENEAYGVGAASLVPFAGLVRLHRNGLSNAHISEQYGVSEELVRFRMNITRAASAI